MKIIWTYSWREETNYIILKICRGLNNYKAPREEIYSLLEIRAKCNLREGLKKLQFKAFKDGMAPSRINKLNFLDVIGEDEKLIKSYMGIVNEVATKHRIKP